MAPSQKVFRIRPLIWHASIQAIRFRIVEFPRVRQKTKQRSSSSHYIFVHNIIHCHFIQILVTTVVWATYGISLANLVLEPPRATDSIFQSHCSIISSFVPSFHPSNLPHFNHHRLRRRRRRFVPSTSQYLYHRRRRHHHVP